jgi:hypothetical protein
MASGKSQIVPFILEMIPEESPPGSYIPNMAMTVANEKHDWTFALLKAPVPGVKIDVHNLLDGCQYIESGLPTGERLKLNLTWHTAFKSFVAIVQKHINDGNALPVESCGSQKTLILFDQSKNVSLAKKPEQNVRRIDRVKEDVDVVFPFERIEEYTMHDYDIIPDTWRAMCVYGKYKNKITDFMVKKMFNESPFKLDQTRRQNVYLWRYGKVGDVIPDEAFGKEIEQTLECMGEYDFASMRYIIKIVRDAILSGSRDLSSIVFRVFTTDTDLLLNMLYLIESIKERYDLHVDKLPTIILISPWFSKRIVHINNLFRILKYRIQHDYGHPDGRVLVRNFCLSIFSWGNDLMPSPFFIVGKCYLDVFLKYRPMLRNPLADMRGEGHKYPSQCAIDGKSFKMFYLLTYAHRHMKDEDKEDLWTQRVDGCINDKKVEDMIISSFTKVKKPMMQAKHPQGDENIQARLIMINYMLYSIEHALCNVKGHKLPLSDLILHDSTHDQLWNDYLKVVNPEAHENAMSLGLINERACIYYSRLLKPNKKENMVELLKKYVETVHKRFIFGDHVYNRMLLASCSNDMEAHMAQYSAW